MKNYLEGAESSCLTDEALHPNREEICKRGSAYNAAPLITS
jgi:hypothetical protein